MGKCLVILLIIAIAGACLLACIAMTSAGEYFNEPQMEKAKLGINGLDYDGRSINVDKGEKFSVTFIEYGGSDSWKMRPNADVKVINDVIMESYPMQHVLSFKAFNATTLVFDNQGIGDGKKTVSIHVNVKGREPNTGPSGIPYDPTFDIPPVVIDGRPDSDLQALKPGSLSGILRGLLSFKISPETWSFNHEMLAT